MTTTPCPFITACDFMTNDGDCTRSAKFRRPVMTFGSETRYAYACPACALQLRWISLNTAEGVQLEA